MLSHASNPVLQALQQEIGALQAEVDRIKTQLEVAKLKASQGKDKIDPTWYHRATTALRNKRRVMQEKINRYSAKKDEIKKAYQSRYERQFVNHAREMLDVEDFRRIHDMAAIAAEEDKTD